MNAPLDLSGKIFGRLTALSRLPKRRWVCRCECGAIRDFSSSNLVSGVSKSCGCLRDELAKQRATTHGLSYSPEYKVWEAMRGRCNWVNSKSFVNYGGRGIIVCCKWEKSFESFIQDMGPRPSPRHTLERRNNNGNYCKENCFWATRDQQANNKRNNNKFWFQGKQLLRQ